MILYGPLLLICTRNVLIPHEKHLLILYSFNYSISLHHDQHSDNRSEFKFNIEIQSASSPD